MIETYQLSKSYGPFRAVSDLSFCVPQGQVCGFLGPNGAGKSTTIRMLTGFHPPTSGSAKVAGFDVVTQSAQARASMGYLPEQNPLYSEMRVAEYLHFSGQLFGMSRKERQRRIVELVPLCGMEKIIGRVIGQLSKGNRQRVGLAATLLHEPPVLILDEPTSGLDPSQMVAFRDMVMQLKDKHTILISSHYIPQMEQAAGQVVIIVEGRVVAQGSPQELSTQASLGSPLLVEVMADQSQVREVLMRVPGVGSLESQPCEQGHVRMVLRPNETADGVERVDLRPLVSSAVREQNWTLVELRREAATLEDFFVAAVARKRETCQGGDV